MSKTKGRPKGTKYVPKISRAEFRAGAKPVVLSGGKELSLTLAPKEFSTGSLGWTFSGKVYINVGGKMLLTTVNVNATVYGSQHLPSSEEEPCPTEPSSPA